jgi:hypothetical protein
VVILEDTEVATLANSREVATPDSSREEATLDSNQVEEVTQDRVVLEAATQEHLEATQVDTPVSAQKSRAGSMP